MTTTLDVLRAARALLTEKGWTQGAQARDAEGHTVSPMSPDAARFCALGALRHAAGSYHVGDPVRALKATADCDPGLLSRWNDRPRRKVGSVLALFDRTIRRLEREGAR